MDRDKWLQCYRTNKDAVWIKCKLSNGEDFYLDNIDGWRNIKRICDDTGVFPRELYLQFRSHEVSINLMDAEAVYMSKSAKGVFGGETTDFYVTGVLKSDGKVHKEWWQIPELVIERSVVDTIDQCFEETLIYDKRENGEE